MADAEPTRVKNFPWFVVGFIIGVTCTVLAASWITNQGVNFMKETVLWAIGAAAILLLFWAVLDLLDLLL